MERKIETIKEELKTLERKMLIATMLFSLAFIFATLQIVNLIDLNRQYVETLVESNKQWALQQLAQTDENEFKD